MCCYRVDPCHAGADGPLQPPGARRLRARGRPLPRERPGTPLPAPAGIAGRSPGRVAEPQGGPRRSSRREPAGAASVEVLKDSDIFINCALIDDQPLSTDQRGWVSQLQRHLEVRLEQLWGEPLKIGRYPMPAGEPPVSEEFFNELAQVKTMISVVSPPFLKAEGCRREVAAFYQHATNQGGLWYGEKARLLKVVKTPVEMRDMPAPLSEIFARLADFNFFELDAATGRVREFDESFGPIAKQRFFERIYDLAQELCLVLKACRSGQQTAGAAPFTGRTDLPGRNDGGFAGRPRQSAPRAGGNGPSRSPRRLAPAGPGRARGGRPEIPRSVPDRRAPGREPVRSDPGGRAGIDGRAAKSLGRGARPRSRSAPLDLDSPQPDARVRIARSGSSTACASIPNFRSAPRSSKARSVPSNSSLSSA